MQTSAQLKEIMTLDNIKNLFETTEEAIKFFQSFVNKYKKDLLTLEKIVSEDSIINYKELHKVSTNNGLISTEIKRAKGELNSNLKTILLNQITLTELKIKIIKTL